MKEKIKEIISIIFIALFMATLLFAWLTEPMDEYYIQSESETDGFHYSYVKE